MEYQEVSGGGEGRIVWELKKLLGSVGREEPSGGSGLPHALHHNPVGWRQDAKEKPFSEKGPGPQKVFTGPRCLDSEGQAEALWAPARLNAQQVPLRFYSLCSEIWALWSLTTWTTNL